MDNHILDVTTKTMVFVAFKSLDPPPRPICQLCVESLGQSYGPGVCRYGRNDTGKGGGDEEGMRMWLRSLPSHREGVGGLGIPLCLMVRAIGWVALVSPLSAVPP